MKKNIVVLFLICLIFLNCAHNDDVEKTYTKPTQFIDFLLSRGIEHECRARIIVGDRKKDDKELNIYHYDREKINDAEKRIEKLNVNETLMALFSRITNGKITHKEKWLTFSDFLSKIMRHPPFTQPMYRDKTIVTHPLVLLYLGESRCGHIARIIVDVAHANGYEARLVQLACHVVAEVKYDGDWHWIDTNADFSLSQLLSVFPEKIPSTKELSENPYIIDQLAARGWEWSEQRSLENNVLYHVAHYPGKLKTSSIYFGKGIFENKYTGDPTKPRPGLIYYYKNGSIQGWENSRYYGWENYRSEVENIKMVPVEFRNEVPILTCQKIIHIKRDKSAMFRVRFFGAPNTNYQLRISSKFRGWNDDFRNYNYMPRSGSGDVLITQCINFGGNLYGYDREVFSPGRFFIEVREVKDGKEFLWPSNEIQVQIIEKADHD